MALDKARRQEAARERQHRLRLTWKQRLIQRLLELSPAAFERLAQRLLREAGFVNVSVFRPKR